MTLWRRSQTVGIGTSRLPVAVGTTGNVAGVDPSIEGGVADADEVGGQVSRDGSAKVRFQVFANLADPGIAAAVLGVAKARDPVQGLSSLLHGHGSKSSRHRIAEIKEIRQLCNELGRREKQAAG